MHSKSLLTTLPYVHHYEASSIFGGLSLSFKNCKFLRLTLSSLSLLLWVEAVSAAPQGGQVVAGEGTIQQTDPNTTLIQQYTGSLAIDWQSFDVAQQETVRFQQPSSSSAVLNRIWQQQPSEILGAIEANGRVFLMNPNGIIFGESSRVNVGALVAGAFDISPEDFMLGNFNLRLRSDHDGGLVVNRGVIEAASGGSVTLVGNEVKNQGLIVANYGKVHLAAGGAAELDFDGDGLIRFEVSDAMLQNAIAVESAVSNSGTIIAHAGEVLLTADAAQDVFDSLVNNSGKIDAGRVDNTGGIVRLEAKGGKLTHSGDIDVSAQDDTSAGGTVQVLADSVTLENDSSVDASGATGGGTVLIGGDYRGGNANIKNAEYTYVASGATIKADAGQTGNGGSVTVWADHTTDYRGSISVRGGQSSGDGGFVEVSGKQLLAFSGTVDATATNGVFGTLLLDPYTLRIVDTASVAGYCKNTMSWGAIDSLGNNANVILEAQGDIHIEDVTGTAGGDISENNLVKLDIDSGSLSITSTGGSILFADKNDVIRTEGGAVTMQAGGGGLVVGGIDTTGEAGNKGGSVLLEAAGDIEVRSVNAGLSDVVINVDTQNNTAATLQLNGTLSGGSVQLVGSAGADDTLIGPDTENEWKITGINSGTLNSMEFVNIANLVGGSQIDTFALAGGTLTGHIDGQLGMDELAGSNYYEVTQNNGGFADGLGDDFYGSAAGNFKNIENLTGTEGNDTFVFKGFGVTGVVNGVNNTDVDTLDYSAHPQGIYVNLADNTATGTGGFKSIEAMIGGTGNDTLKAANTDNMWVINGTNEGEYNGVFSFSNTENLTGGNKADHFVFSDGKGVTGIVDGGGGSDALDYRNYSSAASVDLAKKTATGTGGIANIETVLPIYPPEMLNWKMIEPLAIDNEVTFVDTAKNEEQEKKEILARLAKITNRPEINDLSTDVLVPINQVDPERINIVITMQGLDDWLEQDKARQSPNTDLDMGVNIKRLWFSINRKQPRTAGRFIKTGGYINRTLTNGSWEFYKTADVSETGASQKHANTRKYTVNTEIADGKTLLGWLHESLKPVANAFIKTLGIIDEVSPVPKGIAFIEPEKVVAALKPNEVPIAEVTFETPNADSRRNN